MCDEVPFPVSAAQTLFVLFVHAVANKKSVKTVISRSD